MSVFDVQHKFLLIEDDPIIARLYKTKLEALGQIVVDTNDGRRGFELIKEVKPNIIITDIALPNMDGIEILESIKSLETKIPVIVLTNNENPEIRKKAMSLGASVYLIKAETLPRQLIEKAEQILQKT